MIHRWLAHHAAADPERVALSWPEGRLTYGQLAARVTEHRAREATAGRSLELTGSADVEFFVSLLASDGLAVRVFLLPPGLEPADVTGATSSEVGTSEGVETRVVLFTSGTTGAPKAAVHTWSSLAASVHQTPALAGTRWLLTYAPASYAGLQVLLHALINGGSVAFGATDASGLARLSVREGSTHVSGTPTFYRVLLATTEPETLARLAWKQITLGGEPVDQPILDALAARFPTAQITHIYASTEDGVGFSVHDGRAGFPARYLERSGSDVELRVVENELQIRSRSGMKGYLGQPEGAANESWRGTGDLVRIEGDRVLFLGRRTDRINVGGLKLFPAEVEEVLLATEGVRGARAYGTPSSLTGQIVAVDVVLEPGASPEAMRARILTTCRERLAAHKVPRILKFVDALETTGAGKLRRT